MDLIRQQKIDKAMSNFKFKFVTDLISSCKDNEEAIYITCSLAHDWMQMLYKAINANAPAAEAQAAFKIALDSVLLDMGMSIQIHQMKQG